MEDYQKILTLENEAEATVLESVLDQEQIPYILISHHDTAYDGLWQTQRGWGHIEAPEKYRNKIISLYRAIKTK